MKKYFKLIFASLIVSLTMTGCLYEESMDSLVEWGFAKDTDSEIVNGLETVLPSAQVIFNAFDECFFSDYDKSLSGHEAIMREQHSQSQALKNAKKTAERAASRIDANHSCPADYIFVVRVQYGVDGAYKTAWSHDYR